MIYLTISLPKGTLYLLHETAPLQLQLLKQHSFPMFQNHTSSIPILHTQQGTFNEKSSLPQPVRLTMTDSLCACMASQALSWLMKDMKSPPSSSSLRHARSDFLKHWPTKISKDVFTSNIMILTNKIHKIKTAFTIQILEKYRHGTATFTKENSRGSKHHNHLV